MFDDSLKGHPAPRRGLWPLSLFLFLGFVVGITGCGGCSSGSPTSGTTGKAKPEPPSAGWDLLEPALAMMQPENLGINADPNQPTGLLNQWRRVQMEVEKKDPDKDRFSAPLSDETRKLLENDLSAEAARRAGGDEFTADDARHIRTARLMKSIVDHVAKGVDGELGRAQAVFDYVTRNMKLVAAENALPLTPYEMLVFGEGTAEDRAWVFAELLRQLNQDAVIVKPASESTEPAPWFVGAVVKDEIRLFDPNRSTPVPATLGAKSQDITPATIADLSKPGILQSLTAGTEAKISSQMFEKVRLEIIGTSGLWSPRLAVLQGFLSGESSVVISQNLTGQADEASSIVNRIKSLEDSRFSPEDLRLWSHPESRLEGFDALESLSERWKPFDAPQRIEVNPNDGTPVFGTFSKLQLKIRTEQLMGLYKEAIPMYSRVRIERNRVAPVLSGDVLRLHADAAEDAYFWSAICQMESGDFHEAATKFAAYVKDFENVASRHGDHARILSARCLIEQDRPAEAMEALAPLKPASPEYATAIFLTHALKNAKATPDKTQPQVSETPKPEPQKPETQKPAIAEKPAA